VKNIIDSLAKTRTIMYLLVVLAAIAGFVLTIIEIVNKGAWYYTAIATIGAVIFWAIFGSFTSSCEDLAKRVRDIESK